MTQPRIQKAFQKALVPVFLALLFVMASAGVSPMAEAFSVSAWQAEPPLLDGLPPCPNKALAAGLRQASEAYFVATQAAMQDHYDRSLEQDRINPKKYQRGKILDTYCLSVQLDFFNVISQLISGFSLIEAAIKALINSILSSVCSYVYNAVTSVLNTFCLPLPSFSFSASLPSGPSHSTCAGISLADAIKVTPGQPLKTLYPLSSVYQSRPMSRWLGNDRF